MRLTAHTDYAMRILLHAAAARQRDPRLLLSIAEVARAHDISRNHAMKIVSHLGHAGFLETVRGRSGGFRLAREPETIRIGAVVRSTEPCLEPALCKTCALNGACGFSTMLDKAVAAFLAVLDDCTLADAARTTRIDLTGGGPAGSLGLPADNKLAQQTEEERLDDYPIPGTGTARRAFSS